MADKKTKKDLFTEVKAVLAASNVANKEELMKFIDHELELLDKKAGNTSKKKEDSQNEIFVAILDAMEKFETPVSVYQLLKESPELESYTEGKEVKEMTLQKLTSMVTKLVKSGDIIRTEEKKKAYFSLPKSQAVDTMTDGEENEVSEVE